MREFICQVDIFTRICCDIEETRFNSGIALQSFFWRWLSTGHTIPLVPFIRRLCNPPSFPYEDVSDCAAMFEDPLVHGSRRWIEVLETCGFVPHVGDFFCCTIDYFQISSSVGWCSVYGIQVMQDCVSWGWLVFN